MASGNPNAKKYLGFTAKVRNPYFDPNTADATKPWTLEYQPVYVAPDATNEIYGDVLLSDSITSNSNAATGVTAASPKAVKTVQDNAETKLSKIVTDEQTVAGPVNFQSLVLSENEGFKGNLNGNAASATKLDIARVINITNNKIGENQLVYYTGAVDFSEDITIGLSNIDASTVTKGTLPLSVIPKAAQERMLQIANDTERFALTSNEVQKGDTVYVFDPTDADSQPAMYLVVDDSKLDSEDGYQEYISGTAVKVYNTVQLTGDISSTQTTLNTSDPITISTTIGNDTIGLNNLKSEVQTVYVGSSEPTDSNVAVWIKTS